MNISSIVIVILLTVYVAWIIYRSIAGKKPQSGCNGDCANCRNRGKHDYI